MGASEPRHWVLWDGACDFCAWSMARLRRRDVRGQFQIVPYQLAPAELLERTTADALGRSVHVFAADGRVLRGGRAVLFIGEQLGYGWLTRPLSLPPMVWGVEGVYWVIARLRGKLSRWLRISETECPR
ncbi:MAG: thiol-disulfide oxidoreductase DCC family protein [Fimbriimonadales bacterium]